MRVRLLGAVFALVSFSAVGAEAAQVRGYTRSDGTYVAPHYRSSPSSSGSSSGGIYSPGIYSGGIYSSPNSRDHQVDGYVTRNGTYVAPSRATNPNNTLLDNYSTKPNVNPYSGRTGSKSPYGY